MAWILKILWFLFKQQAEMTVVDAAKIQALESYLKAVGGLRRVVLSCIGALVLVQLFALSFVGLIASAILLVDLPPPVKIEIALGICAFFAVLISVVFLRFAREDNWYRLSGAEKLVDDFASEHQAQLTKADSTLSEE